MNYDLTSEFGPSTAEIVEPQHVFDKDSHTQGPTSSNYCCGWLVYTDIFVSLVCTKAPL